MKKIIDLIVGGQNKKGFNGHMRPTGRGSDQPALNERTSFVKIQVQGKKISVFDYSVRYQNN